MIDPSSRPERANATRWRMALRPVGIPIELWKRVAALIERHDANRLDARCDRGGYAAKAGARVQPTRRPCASRRVEDRAHPRSGVRT